MFNDKIKTPNLKKDLYLPVTRFENQVSTIGDKRRLNRIFHTRKLSSRNTRLFKNTTVNRFIDSEGEGVIPPRNRGPCN